MNVRNVTVILSNLTTLPSTAKATVTSTKPLTDNQKPIKSVRQKNRYTTSEKKSHQLVLKEKFGQWYQ